MPGMAVGVEPSEQRMTATAQECEFTGVGSRRSSRFTIEGPLTDSLLTETSSQHNDRFGLGLFDVCPPRDEA